MNIGSIIKELRQKKKMSQQELAEYLSVSTKLFQDGRHQ
jgi:DNA-binding transcriptional regulator YiaG